MLRTRANSIIF